MLFWPVVAPLFVACVPGAVVVSMVAVQAENVPAILTGRFGRESQILLATSLCSAALGTAACFYSIRIERQLRRLLAAVGCGLAAAVVAAGIVFWVKMELGGRLLMLSAQIALALLLLRAGRNAWEVVTGFRESPLAAVRQIAPAAAGSLVAAAVAGGVAMGRGLELSLLARPHWFYALTVPAIAGFGLTVTKPNVPSNLLGVLTLIVVMLTISYSLGTALFGAPEIFCDMHIRNPHYQVLGFDWEPWHWSQREDWRWIFAPGALTELSLLHIFDPVPNIDSPTPGYCER